MATPLQHGRPHSSLGYRPPAPEAIIPPSWPSGSAPLRRPPRLAAKPTMHYHRNRTSQQGQIIPEWMMMPISVPPGPRDRVARAALRRQARHPPPQSFFQPSGSAVLPVARDRHRRSIGNKPYKFGSWEENTGYPNPERHPEQVLHRTRPF